MKVTIAILLLNAISITTRGQTVADSDRCPWKLPFYVSLSATYEQNTIEGYYNGGALRYDTILENVTDTGTTTAEILVDSNSFYSFRHDTLQYVIASGSRYPGIGEGGSQISLSIIFVPRLDSISSISYYYDTTFNGLHYGWDNGFSFELLGFRYDSNSIVCLDSSLSHGSFSLSYNEGYDSFFKGQEEPLQTHTNALRLLSLTLGGIFQPITLSPPAAVSSHRGATIGLSSYPNPFIHNIAFSFASSEGRADISISNFLGIEVAHLYSGELSAGNHSFTWEPHGVPAGMYECVVRMNGQVQTLPILYEP